MKHTTAARVESAQMALRSRPKGTALLSPSARARSNLAEADKEPRVTSCRIRCKSFFYFLPNLCDMTQLKSDPMLKYRVEELS